MSAKIFKPTAFVLSDLHLGHKNILGFCRPWFKTIEEHDNYIIDQINKTCGPDDILILLGDIAWNKTALHRLDEVLAKLVLIGGNHDYFSPSTYTQYFDKLYGVGQMVYKHKRIVLTHIPVHPDQLIRWEYNIHGHLHTYHVDDGRYLNASCEPMNFTPRRISELLDDRIKELDGAELAVDGT